MSSITQIRKSTNRSPKNQNWLPHWGSSSITCNLISLRTMWATRCDVIEWYKEIGTNIHMLPLRIEMRWKKGGERKRGIESNKSQEYKCTTQWGNAPHHHLLQKHTPLFPPPSRPSHRLLLSLKSSIPSRLFLHDCFVQPHQPPMLHSRTHRLD